MEEPTRSQRHQLERGIGGSVGLWRDSKGRLRFFPVTVIGIASVLTIVLLVGLGVQTWQSYHDYHHMLDKMEDVEAINYAIEAERHHKAALITVISLLVEVPCLLLIWFLFLRNMRKYLKERDEFNAVVAKNEEKYRSLFQNSQDAIILLKTTDDSIFDANEQACKLLGYSYEDFLSMTIWDLHPKEEHGRAEQLKSQALSTGSFEGAEDIHYLHKGGSTIPVSVTTTIIESEPYPIALVHVHDVSEKKLAEQALRESEQRFRSLVGNIPGAVYRCELCYPWGVEHISEAVFDIAGYHSSDFMEGRIDFGSMIFSEDVDKISQTVDDATANHTSYEVEYRLRHLDGSVRWIREHGVVVYDESDKAVWLDGVIFDVTSRKKSEQERERLLSTLATKNEELQSIVYVASHDLKTPLVNILGFSGELVKTCEQLGSILESEDVSPELKAKLAPLVYEDAPEALRFIVAGGSKMQSLLNGLLEVSRVDSTELNIEEIGMSSMMRGIVASMQFQISDSGTEVNIGQLPHCKADDDAINQVFSNLLANAVKYLDPERPGVINVTGEVLESEVIYCVEDNGLGIASEQQRKVFEIFHRLDPSGNVKGEGLGLTIALRILERHEGRIWVESEQGKGSKFFVSLPAT